MGITDDLGDELILTNKEIILVKKWFCKEYGYNPDVLDISEVIPVYLVKEGGGRLFEVKYAKFNYVNIEEDEFLKIIKRIK